jgi:N-acetylmuramoyl-L-alanine amidase
MSRAKKIKYIVIHCTAGFKSAFAVQDYFTRSKDKGGRGWRTGGYHRIVETNGAIAEMYDFSRVTNGVRDYNSEAIHISYVGGISRGGYNAGKYNAEDTRTFDQKISIEKCIIEALEWLHDNGKDITKDLMILGHRDFSTDKNGNNIIESWERIKECPCFDAIEEYNGLYGATNSTTMLPKNRK